MALFMSMVITAVVRRHRKPSTNDSATIPMEIVVQRNCGSLPSGSGNSHH